MKVNIHVEVDTNDTGDCQMIEDLVQILNEYKELVNSAEEG